MRHRAFRSVSVTLLTLLTLHLSLDAQQAPGIFERDNEGQIWQTLPSFGRPAAPCDWADIDPGANDIGHPVFDPDGTIDPTGELEPLRESGAPLQCPGASEPGPNAVDQLYDPRGVAVFDPGPTTPALSATPDLDATRMSRYRVYAADTLNHRIVSWDFFGGDPRAFGTGVNPVGPDGSLNFGPRDAYPEDQLFYPEGVAVDAAGHVLVADQYNGRVSVFREDESHWFVKTLPPDGAFRGHRAMPSQIAVVPGVTIQVPAEACEVVGAPAVAVTTWTPWFVSDDPAYDGTGMSQVLVYDAQFCLVRALGNPASMDWFDPSYGLDAEWPSPRGSFWMPNQVVFDSAGRLFVADSANYKIEIFDAALEPLMMICNPDPANSPHADCAPGPGVIATTDLTGSYGVAIDTRPVIDPVTRTIKAGWQRLVIANHREHEVSMFEVNLDTAEAEFAFRLRSDGGLAGYPRAVATDQAGRYFVVIPGLDKVQMFDVPALAVFDQAWEPAAGGSAASVQPGQDFYVAYSIVVPPLKPTVVSVTPAISWTGPAQPVDGDSNSVAEPVAEALVGPQPPTDLEHARVLRYRFRFRALDSSAAEMVFTVGASGNPQGGDFVTTAVPKTVVVPIVCADCEQDPPVISASPLQPDPRPFYNDTVVYRDGRINLIANDVIAASGEASGISRISYWFAGPEAAVQPGVRAVLVDSGAAAPTAPVDLIGRTLTTGGDALIHLTQSGQHTIHFEAWDGNGNPSGEQTLTFFLDLDVPFAAFTRPPAAGTDVNGRPWWNSSVSLSASRTDNMTQPADVTMTPSTLTFSSEGMDQRIEVTLEDKAGNTSTLQTPLVSIDMTAPLTTVSPGEGAYPAAVTVTLSAVDAASGVRSLTYSLSGAACLVSSPPPACAGDVTIDGSTASVTFSAPGSTLVTYRAVDWATNSEVVRAATYTINQGPVAVDDAASLAEDSSITLTVLDNDQDEDGGTIEIVTIVEAPAHGSAVINGQTIVYTPASNYAGSDSFRYRIRDSQGATAEATVRITVTGEADPPDAFHDQVETPEDVAIDVNVLLNDTNPDGGALTIVSFTQPDGGTVTFGPNATLRYTPHANVNGGDTFTYTIRNDAGDTDGATVFVTVLPRNDGPIATDDAVTTLEDTPVVINALGNDTHPDGASTTLVSVSPSVTAQGAASIVNQAVVFTPAANFFGTVTLTYTVADPDGDTDTAIITIAVTPVNDPPIAADDAATTTSTTPVLIPVLANDSDIDGGALTVASFTPPLSGAVTVSAGVFTYTAANGYVGVDTFTYTVSDGNGGTDVATVTVTVDPAGQSCEADATPLALVRRQAMFNGRTEGSVQVMTAVDVTFNSGSTLTGDLFIVGTPSVRINGTPAAYGGTVDGTGAATPTNHWVTVNSGASVGRIVRRTDAVTMPTVANPPNPTGTRSLALNQPSESPGSFATIRDLTLNSNYGNVVVPEGTYGTFTANSGTSFTLGVAGAETPAVYNFQSLNLNSQSELRMVGPVVITLQNQAAFNGNVGASAHPEWLTLRIANGGLQLNNSISVYGYVEAPNGEVTVNGGTRLVGGLAADKLTVNSNGTLTLQALPADCEPEPTPVTVTVASASKVYGSADPVFTYAVFGADPSVVTGAPSRVTGEAVGTYTIGQGTLTVTGNYTLTVQPGTLTITPAPLTVRADDASRVYGAPNPSFTATLAGFVNGDDEYDLGGTLAFTTPATPASPMGGYAITPSGLTSANYTISYLDGTLTVTRKPVSVEVIPSGGPYDGAPKVAACVITDGLVGTLTYVGTGATTYGPSATAPVNAGTYLATCVSPESSNYDGPVTEDAPFTISTVAITVAADPKAKVYGDSDPVFTWQIASGALVGADTMTGSLSRLPGENLGVFPIGQNTLTAGPNYVLTYVGANLTITGRPVTITVEPKTKVYGSADPALTYALGGSGLVAGDTLSGALTREPGDIVGSYGILQGTLAAGSNYDLTFVGSALTITPKAATVTAGSGTKVYGAADPALTPTATGFLSADVPAITLAGSRTAGEGVGTYATSATAGGAPLSNYTVSYVAGSLVITKATPIATVTGGEFEYDGQPHAATCTVLGPNGPLAGTLSYSPGPGVPLNEGTYTATCSFAGDDNHNAAIDTALIIISTPTCSVNGTGAGALVRKEAIFNGGSRTEGSVQVMTGSNVTFNGGAELVGDLFIVGTPKVTLKGAPSSYAGTVDGTGSATPNNHTVTISGGASLGRVVRRTAAVALPIVSAPPAPTGSRTVTLNRANDNPGSFATIKNLTLNGNAGTVAVPPGTYGTFNANAQSAFKLGVTGATTPVVYNFRALTLNGQSRLEIVGPVVITVKSQVNFNALAGTSAHPEWLTLRIATGGVHLNGQAQFYGYIEAPNGSVIVNGGTKLVGGLAADTLTVNGQGRLILRPIDTCEPVNVAPVAVNDTYTTQKGTVLTVTGDGVLVNDTDEENDDLTVEVVTPPASGTLTLNPGGSFTYTPAANFTGQVTFTYKTKDEHGAYSAPATATITVIAPPVAVNDSYSTPKSTTLDVAAPGLLGNDSDPNGTQLIVELVSGPDNGTLTLNTDGSFRYKPSRHWYGTDTFTYSVKNADGVHSTPATVTIKVTKPNVAPDADNDNYSTKKNTKLTIQAPGVLKNDSDANGNTLTAQLVTGVAKGSLTLNANGSFTYTPASNWTGTVTFTYKAKDADGLLSEPATVTITVHSHYDGDNCDHDRKRWGHYDGDGDDHDRHSHKYDRDDRDDDHSSHHRDGDGDDHDRRRNGHYNGDGCEHDRQFGRDDDRDGGRDDRGWDWGWWRG